MSIIFKQIEFDRLMDAPDKSNQIDVNMKK